MQLIPKDKYARNTFRYQSPDAKNAKTNIFLAI